MKFSTLSILTFVAAAVADLKFDATVYAPDTTLDGVAIKKVDSHLFVFSVGGDEGVDLSLTFKDSALEDQDGTGVYVNSDTGEVGSVSGTQSPTEDFSYANDILLYQGKSEWKACPSGENKYSLVTGVDCDGSTDIYLVMSNQQEV
ncbi:hypothetical protein HYPBUDRAFT_145247 [Hyphopichia burtonii NRRL Y-1933]|uniref:Cell wall protein n=1 Tax=Hyphopichia burtonii NRRL Y-1933 TaxID=984485 RepID=A0A1E4RBK6_9ASCO|nr:hypothetical protein HYPBUDRAFT_145247 [Hyphopichia burtonii NRRL Y-1933]ODV64616.1 hypothetical protein HYPBUDRAFT_145247 [Hyphopichia burtonii NRRL Y-1933]